MSESLRSLIPPAEQYVVSIFSDKIGKDLSYHSFEHTREVVINCELIAGNYELSDADYTALILAAWFHDTGYSVPGRKVHEEESQRMLRNF
jgi:HD superfamily phosphodiesterase